MNDSKDVRGLGCSFIEGGAVFRIWAPRAKTLYVEIDAKKYPLIPQNSGYHEGFVEGVAAGTLYKVWIDDQGPFPDPASRFQPEGAHGPSEVIDPSKYQWKDQQWRGIPQSKWVFYELHVGTFSKEGTFAGVEKQLDYLKELGVTAIELMPLGAFPGRWNWGYDPGSLFAPYAGYGRPDDLRRLVDSAHQKGLAVFLDVIYNHFSPDGAYVVCYGDYLTDKHHTSWGKAINFDANNNAGVRNFFVENALYWLQEYHFDGLRLDATYAIVDTSPKHFLQELQEAVEKVEDFPRYLVAEDNRNTSVLIAEREKGGYGLSAMWADDFHHQTRNLATKETWGYLKPFKGTTPKDLAKTLDKGWLHPNTPQDSTEGIPRNRFVFCIQNHDQIGNRARGDRLTEKISMSFYQTLSALLLFAEETPLIFMGQEWAASSPFLYFTDHAEPLGTQVTKGRQEMFSKMELGHEGVTDPQKESSFTESRLDWSELEKNGHKECLAWYQKLLHLRDKLDAFQQVKLIDEKIISLTRGKFTLLAVLDEGNQQVKLPEDSSCLLATSSVTCRLEEILFHGPGAIIFERQS